MEKVKFEDFTGVSEETAGRLGKLTYFTLSDVLLERAQLDAICMSLAMQPLRTKRCAAIDAFKSATGDVRETVKLHTGSGAKIIKIYFRDNSRAKGDICSRELVKETLGQATNRYKKLANITCGRTTGELEVVADPYDPDVDISAYCNQALELFELHKRCVGRNHLETITEKLLDSMKAVRVGIKGFLFFVPIRFEHDLELMEDFFCQVKKANKRDGKLTFNAIDVIDSAKQRDRMAESYYDCTCKKIALYQEKVLGLIERGTRQASVLERWTQKIDDLSLTKQHYEQILHRNLNQADEEFAQLRFLRDELTTRITLLQAEQGSKAA